MAFHAVGITALLVFAVLGARVFSHAPLGIRVDGPIFRVPLGITF